MVARILLSKTGVGVIGVYIEILSFERGENGLRNSNKSLLALFGFRRDLQDYKPKVVGVQLWLGLGSPIM